MNILTIDTATDYELISVTTDSGTCEFAENVRMSHSVTMFENISSVIERASVTINDIGLIAAGIGPGSFTGVRIAVSTARMIAQILRIPLVGIATQEIFAASVKNEPGEKILVAFDAKKSRVFGALYEDSREAIIHPGDYALDIMLKRLSEGDKLICIGDGCVKYMDLITAESASEGFSFRMIPDFIPSGEITAGLALRKYKESPERYSFYGNTTPLYARKSDAEIARDEKILRGV